MFVFIFLVGLALLLGACAVVIRAVRPRNPARVWRYILASLLAVCTLDHIVGYLYAHTWVSLAKEDSPVVRTDAVAHKYSELPQHRTWYDPLGERNFDPWPPGTPREVYAGYLAWKAAAGFAQVQGYAKSYTAPPEHGKPFEVRISTDPNDPECRWWDVSASVKRWNEDRIDKQAWLDQVRKNWRDGERAACPALHPISEVTAGYLVRTALNLPASALEEALGLREFSKVEVVDRKSNEVVQETRSVKFQGGWVARLWAMGYELGVGPLFVREIRSTPARGARVVPASRPAVRE